MSFSLFSLFRLSSAPLFPSLAPTFLFYHAYTLLYISPFPPVAQFHLCCFASPDNSYSTPPSKAAFYSGLPRMKPTGRANPFYFLFASVEYFRELFRQSQHLCGVESAPEGLLRKTLSVASFEFMNGRTNLISILRHLLAFETVTWIGTKIFFTLSNAAVRFLH